MAWQLEPALRGAAVLLLVAACGACSSATEKASSRCGSPHVTNVYWGGGYDSGGWYGDTGDPLYDGGGDWYDPGDSYTDDGSGDGTSSDGTGSGDGSSGDYASGDDGSGADSSGGDGSGSYSSGDDGSGDYSSGDDSSGDGSSGDDSSGDDSSGLTANGRADLRATNGCWSCTVGCLVGGQGRQAVGVSEVSHDAACRAAVGALEHWAHVTAHARVDSCQQIDAAASSFVRASPTVKASRYGGRHLR